MYVVLLTFKFSSVYVDIARESCAKEPADRIGTFPQTFSGQKLAFNDEGSVSKAETNN